MPFNLVIPPGQRYLTPIFRNYPRIGFRMILNPPPHCALMVSLPYRSSGRGMLCVVIIVLISICKSCGHRDCTSGPHYQYIPAAPGHPTSFRQNSQTSFSYTELYYVHRTLSSRCIIPSTRSDIRPPPGKARRGHRIDHQVQTRRPGDPGYRSSPRCRLLHPPHH